LAIPSLILLQIFGLISFGKILTIICFFVSQPRARRKKNFGQLVGAFTIVRQFHLCLGAHLVLSEGQDFARVEVTKN
jgi:hypothetical protein